MILTGILTGFRPQELATLTPDNVDLENQIITAGMKTEAGRNRIVPIHPLLASIIRSQFESAVKHNSKTLFFCLNDTREYGDNVMNYDRYQKRFKKTMKHYGWTHTCHDTRHTFISLAKEANMNEYILKMIAGHVITDITESVYTHRKLEQIKAEMNKIQIPISKKC